MTNLTKAQDSLSQGLHKVRGLAEIMIALSNSPCEVYNALDVVYGIVEEAKKDLEEASAMLDKSKAGNNQVEVIKAA